MDSPTLSKVEFTKQEKKRLHLLLMPEYSGKTMLCNNLEKYKDNTIFMFLDSSNYIKATYSHDRSLSVIKDNISLKELILFPFLKEHMKKLLQHFNNHNIVIVTSSYRLIPFLNIKQDKMKVLVPDAKLWTEIKQKIKDKTDEKPQDEKIEMKIETKIHQIDDNRDTIMKLYGDILYTYNSFDDLMSIVVKLYDINV